MNDNIKKDRFIIEVDKEFIDILKRLEEKIKKTTWEGIEKIGTKSLTKVLARKIISSKIL